MSLTLLIIIFTVIGILAIVSITVGILNWINLASSSSAVTKLQGEIEKKFQETDSQKKNSGPSPGFQSPESKVITAEDFNEMQHQSQLSPQGGNNNIEIVRNVRGDFNSSNQGNLTQETIPMKK